MPMMFLYKHAQDHSINNESSSSKRSSRVEIDVKKKTMVLTLFFGGDQGGSSLEIYVK